MNISYVLAIIVAALLPACVSGCADPKAKIKSSSLKDCQGASLACEDGILVSPASRFMMGYPGDDELDAYDDSMPSHEVELTTFTISCNLVTVDEYVSFVNSSKADLSEMFFDPSTLFEIRVQSDGHVDAVAEWAASPITNVTWVGAEAYCRWLSKETVLYRLPTEAEWEYVASNGGRTRFPWGNYDPGVIGPSWNETRPVWQGPQKRSWNTSCWGLHDLVGGPSQWCSDFYDDDYYKRSPALDPSGPDEMDAYKDSVTGHAIPYRVERGGFRTSSRSFWDDTIIPRRYSRSKIQQRASPSQRRHVDVGFRWVRFETGRK